MRNFVITVNGKSYEVGVEEVGATASAPVAAAPKAAVSAPQAAPAPVAAAPKATPANGEKVVSPFPGLIKNLLVAEGAQVKKDQPLLVLEAMKMDNDITAPCDGTVSFCVAKGANVESDTVLAVIG
ncbi:MAG: biotin/lipoyl-containing protein [Coriobacteriales bacterium]|jgi:acetyl/propionyl-coA carboxylase, alpha subunit|nr:MAG: acetyl-CoA carboxylase biotin carboxyl carrier protein subunit [Clostridiales bacterium]